MTVTQMIAGQVEALLYDKLHDLLGVIAQDYDLSHGELVEKYLKYKNEVENPKVIYKASEIVEPETKKRKAKVTTKEVKEETREGKCQATTAKGLPCKNNVFGGGCFCRVHTKKEGEEEEPKEKKAPRPKKTAGKALSEKEEPKKRGKALKEEAEKPAPKKRGRKPKKVEPEHNHALDDEPTEECEVCETFGNALNDNDQEFELSPEDIKREALRELLKEELGGDEDVTDEMLDEFQKEMESEEAKGAGEAEVEAEEGEVIEEEFE